MSNRFDYYVLTVIIKMNDRRLWSLQEDSIIEELVSVYGHKKWSVISTEMNKLTGKSSRTSKQIRQRYLVLNCRWYNHLDPSINKTPWTSQQQHTIFQAHKIYGCKWKQISNLLQARTDNSVKNHFYSTLRRSLRRINKYLGFKNSTHQMKLLKPSILSQLIDSAQTNPESKQLVQRMFEFANFKPSKLNMQSNKELIHDEHKLKYQNAIQKLVKFNMIYQKNKRVTHKPTYHPKQQQIHHNHQNLSTISGKQNSQWSVRSQNNAMLPELERPEGQYDLLDQIPQISPDSKYNMIWLQNIKQI